MAVFVLIFLLVAAALGILQAVLKLALILFLSLVLAVALVVWGGWWYLRSRMRAFQRDVEDAMERERRRRSAIDVRHVRNEADERPPGGRSELDP